MSDSTFPPSRRRPSLLLPGLVVLAFVALGARPVQDVTRADRLEIVRGNAVVADIGSDAWGGVIRLLDTSGREAAVLRVGARGGAEVTLNDAAGERALMLLGGPSPAIVAGPAGDAQVVFDAASPPLDDNTIKVIAITLDDLTDEVRNLASRHDDLERDVRELQPGRSTNSLFDRLQRGLDDLRRDQDALERDIRRITDDHARQRSNVSSIERRLSRLETKIRE